MCSICLLLPVQPFTARTHRTTFTESNHYYVPCIPIVRIKTALFQELLLYETDFRVDASLNTTLLTASTQAKGQSLYSLLILIIFLLPLL